MRTVPAAILACVTATAAHAGSTESCVEGGSIPDGGSIERIIVVAPPPSPQAIVGVRVRIEGTHPWVGDLRASLVHPSGVTVTLLDRPGIPSTGFPGPWGCGGDDFRCTLADDATAAIESTCSFGPPPVLAGELRPNAPLSALVGLAPGGAWRLVIEDAVAGDAGSLTLACLEIESAADCRADLDGSGHVDAADLAEILARWGACTSCPADLDRDGQVGSSDLTTMLASWGACGPS